MLGSRSRGKTTAGKHATTPPPTLPPPPAVEEPPAGQRLPPPARPRGATAPVRPFERPAPAARLPPPSAVPIIAARPPAPVVRQGSSSAMGPTSAALISPRRQNWPVAVVGPEPAFHVPQTHCGLLLKRGPTKKHDYKVRWCHMDTQWLKYYKTQKDTKPLGMIALRDVANYWPLGNGNAPPPNMAASLVFSFLMSESAAGREFVFAAMSDDSKATWTAVLEQNVAALRRATAPTQYAVPKMTAASFVDGTDANSNGRQNAIEESEDAAQQDEYSKFAEQMLREIEQQAEDDEMLTPVVEPFVAYTAETIEAWVYQCVERFVPTDRTQQLEARVGDMFTALVQENVAAGFVLLRRLGKDEAGFVPQRCVRKV